jgi:hypothetical protein
LEKAQETKDKDRSKKENDMKIVKDLNIEIQKLKEEIDINNTLLEKAQSEQQRLLLQELERETEALKQSNKSADTQEIDNMAKI